jgi:pyrroline-5-carboxylate reductase
VQKLISKVKLGVIGAGNMAEALIAGAVKAGVLKGAQVLAADPDPERRDVFAGLGSEVMTGNRDLVAAADVVILAVKPQKAFEVLKEISGVSGGRLFISIMAGISSQQISGELGETARVIRSMPNTPLLVARGAVGFATGRGATPEDMALARELFEASGVVVEVAEEDLDAVTAVSGSGPAYAFFLVEAMIKAGVLEGLNAEAAGILACNTLRGAGELLCCSDESPQQLRARVTSPGGTTQAALDVLDAEGVADKLVKAVRRAAQRSRELGKVERD